MSSIEKSDRQSHLLTESSVRHDWGWSTSTHCSWQILQKAWRVPVLTVTAHLNDVGGGFPNPACFICSIGVWPRKNSRSKAPYVLESCLSVRKLRKVLVERCRVAIFGKTSEASYVVPEAPPFPRCWTQYCPSAKNVFERPIRSETDCEVYSIISILISPCSMHRAL